LGHGISFEDAARIFDDPLALTSYDKAHSDIEERWITLGQLPDGNTLLVAHTFAEWSECQGLVRIISARKASSRERILYESGGALVLEAIIMQDEYELDLSTAVRGKFYSPGAELHIPVYLDREVLDFFVAQANDQGIQPCKLINQILKQDIQRRKASQLIVP
jgi:uncharacterized DUF497 family protein